MKLTKLFLFSLLLPHLAFATLSAQDKQQIPFIGIVPNAGCENGVTGWTAYADAAGATPVDMAGGSPTITVASTTVNPLSEYASCLLTKDSADRQGEGYSQTITVPLGYRGQDLTLSGIFRVASGTYTTGDLKAFVYDVTNNAILTGSGISLTGQQGRFEISFTTLSSTATIRVGIHVATTTTNAFTVAIDNFQAHFGAGSGGGGGGGSADAVTKDITQTTHGFIVGDVLYFDGANYAKAKADDESTSEVLGIVSEVSSVNTFTLTTSGYVSGLSGLVAGTTYYLSEATAGLLTATEPTGVGEVTKPVLVADTTTSGYVIHSRGIIIGSGGGASAFVCSTTEVTADGNFNVSPAMKKLIALGVAGGGAGGEGQATASSAGGGAGGNWSEQDITNRVSPGDTIVVDVGAGGVYVSGDGADGSDTTLTVGATQIARWLGGLGGKSGPNGGTGAIGRLFSGSGGSGTSASTAGAAGQSSPFFYGTGTGTGGAGGAAGTKSGGGGGGGAYGNGGTGGIGTNGSVNAPADCTANGGGGGGGGGASAAQGGTGANGCAGRVNFIQCI